MKPISDAVLASTLFTAVQAVAMAPEPAAMGGEVLPCRGPVISVIVVDDAVSASPMLVDKWRQFKVASPASAVRSVLEDSGCVMVLDNDPVFAAISGTAQPEAVLRVRIAGAKSGERSLGQRAGSAVGRYIGSYLGDSVDDIPQLQSLELMAEVLCAKTRRVTTRFSVAATAADGSAPADNGAVVNEASYLVARDFTSRAREHPGLCGSPESGVSRAAAEQSAGPR